MHFDESDVVRHHLVQRIIRAYDEHKNHTAEQQMLLVPRGKSAEGKIAEAKNSEAGSANERPKEASGE